MKRIVLGIAFAVTLISCQGTKKEVISTYDDGKAQVAYFVKEKDGKKERVKEEMYYEDGTVRYTGNFKDEKPDGKWQYFYKEGTLFAETEFSSEQSLSVAKWKFYALDGKPLIKDPGELLVTLTPDMCPTTIDDIRGNTTYQILLHPNFFLKGKGSLENKIPQGKWTYWFENGNTQTEGTFLNGVLDGPQTVYHENGKVFYKGNHKNGVRVGMWEFYDENEKLLDAKDFGNPQQ